MPQRNMTPAEVLNHLDHDGGPLGATEVFPQDRYPFRVVRISPSGKTIFIVPLRTVDLTTGHQPARREGPWPVWDHAYTDDEIRKFTQEQPPMAVRWNAKAESYRLPNRGAFIRVGEARYYRNFSY